MKGICFIEPLFISVTDRTKTQTRRLMVPQPDERGPKTTNILFEDWHGSEIKPRYKKGEKLYLKEPYLDDFTIEKTFYKYKKEDIQELENRGLKHSHKTPGFWKNKLFMPETAARYFIEITDLRVENLQDISEEDCIKEGINGLTEDNRTFKYGVTGAETETSQSHIEAYAALIDSINGKGTWAKNPFVFVYDFKLVKA